jgi:hypothetical protein
MSGRVSFAKLVHIEGAPPGSLLMLFDQERPEETASRFDARKDPNPPLPRRRLSSFRRSGMLVVRNRRRYISGTPSHSWRPRSLPRDRR